MIIANKARYWCFQPPFSVFTLLWRSYTYDKLIYILVDVRREQYIFYIVHPLILQWDEQSRILLTGQNPFLTYRILHTYQKVICCVFSLNCNLHLKNKWCPIFFLLLYCPTETVRCNWLYSSHSQSLTKQTLYCNINKIQKEKHEHPVQLAI